MLRSILLALALAAAVDALAGTGRIVIVNANASGIGFNDPTPVAPVGGNEGTTLGAQRLNVFNAAAAIWSKALDTNVDIIVQADFLPIEPPCTGASGTLGFAGPQTWQRDFSNAPRANTWYPVALANKLAGKDLAPGSADIFVRFNTDVDNANCLGESNWYYGLDGNAGIHTNLFVVVLHELAHGLGVTRFSKDGVDSISDVHILDLTTGRRWNQMTAQERTTSQTNTGKVVWDGAQVRAKTHMFLQPVTTLTITEPSTVARDYDIGTATFGPAASRTGVSGRIVRAADAADEAGPSPTDGCGAFTNATEVAGNLAVVERGNCTFVQKARNAQAAGAAGLIVIDNRRETCLPPGMSGEAADVMIPVISVSQDDGDRIKAELTNKAGVRGFTRNDPSQLAGTSKEGYMRLYTPCVHSAGSSTSHWDTPAMPNLLMEPSINSDLRHGLDLTLYQLLDMGWTVPTPSGRRKIKRGK